MATRFLKINDEFRDSLEETLDKNNHSGKVRPYYYGISYENKIRPGLDFCKMIIMNRNEINLYTSNVSVNRNVFADLNRKRSQIINMIHKTIDDYKTMRQKVENNVDLSSDEIFLKTRSTLKNWEDII
ncbi:hypothetical protein [Holdemanella biformis]|uniref:hypothetical protein n=2 Tax=Holdemanella biformis TaxID=1735 RepID=UPI001897D55C|nr:hypothetical protein [Holdemanella biformis]